MSEFRGFKLGRYSYVPNGGHLPYYDVTTGQARTWNFQEAMDNHANELAFHFENTFNKGWKWTFDAKYMDAPVHRRVHGCSQVLNKETKIIITHYTDYKNQIHRIHEKAIIPALPAHPGIRGTRC